MVLLLLRCAERPSEIADSAAGRCSMDQRAVGLRQRLPGVAKMVDDRIAAVATEIPARDLDAGCRLPPLVFGQIEHPLDTRDRCEIEALRDYPRDRLLAFHQPFENWIKYLVRR